MGALFQLNKTVSIPSFQRNFAWRNDQIDQFLKDIFESARNKEDHFWGPVVFLRRDNNDKKYEVIDGQQRITTTTIFISLLRDEVFALAKDAAPGDWQHNLLSVIQNILFLPIALTEPRFTASYLISGVFKSRVMANPESGGKARPEMRKRGGGMSNSELVNSKDLRKAYLRIKDRIRKEVDSCSSMEEKKILLHSLLEASTTHFEIHSMELSNENDAFILFETMNQRGLRLSPADLLKTLTLREIRDRHPGKDEKITDAIDTWDQAVENIGEYDFTKFLRHYLLSSSETKVQTSKIYEKFATQIQSLNDSYKGGAAEVLSRLEESSIIYAKLLGNEKFEKEDQELQASIVRTNSFSDTHRIFLLGLLTSDVSGADRVLLTRAIERLAFRWIATGGNAQVIEDFYTTTVHELRKNPDSAGVQVALQKILERTPSDAELMKLFISDSIDLQKYVLRRIEESTGGLTLKWNDKISLEHLAPQSPNGAYWHLHVANKSEKDPSGHIYADYMRMWGNLTLLESKLNSSISNSEWKVKLSGGPKGLKGISASTMNLNKAFTALPEWTAGLISQRTNWLKTTSISLSSESWVESGVCPIKMWDPSETYPDPFPTAIEVEEEDAA
jgi:hypothetical protein